MIGVKNKTEKPKSLSKEEQKEVQETIGLLQKEIRAAKNNLRFGINIVSKNLNKNEIKPYKAISKTLRNSKFAYSLSEFENLLNEVSDAIQTDIFLPFVIEDSSTGDMYYFDSLTIRPNRNIDLLSFLKEDLVEFIHIKDSGKLFMDMNRQFSEENLILEKTDKLLTLQNK